MSDAQWTLQKAIYARLRGDAALATRLGDPPRIYDEAPADAAFPFVTLGQATIAAHPGGEGAAVEHKITLHVWSRWGGRQEAKAVMADMFDALHDQDLALDDPGQRLINLRFVFGDVFPRRDGDIHHGLMRFRAVTEPTLETA